MSGRSAHVRKKITETKPHEKPSKHSAGRVRSTTSSAVSGCDDRSTNDQRESYLESGARFLKFAEPTRDSDGSGGRGEFTTFHNSSHWSQNTEEDHGRRGLSKKHSFRTEEASSVGKSSLRNTIDKRSEVVRKGLTKALGLGKKSKKAEEPGQKSHTSPSSHSATAGAGTKEYNYVPPLPPARKTTILGAALGGRTLDVESSSPPTQGLPAVPPPVSAGAIKRWVGAGRPVQKWNKLRKDPELWDPNGDVLVYLVPRGLSPRPSPSFRLSSHIIEATQSRHLIYLLREGSTEEDFHLPPSPAGAPPMLSMLQRYAGTPGRRSPAYSGQPSPPASDDAHLIDTDGQISYEMYFPTPPDLSKAEALRHAITTRNVFALLYHASLVGFSLYEALSDLLVRLHSYMPPEADNVGNIINYLTARGIDDARDDPETAVSILVWAESPDVRWEEGWREAYIHSVGMFSRVESCVDFKHISPFTRALLERASLEIQLRIQAAEERLADFEHNDIWSLAGSAKTPAHAAADRLRWFLIEYYQSLYGEWPPPVSEARTADGEQIWLTRTMAQKLQKDFGALYEYLVDRDIVWAEAETSRGGRRLAMVSKSANSAFEADKPQVPTTSTLIGFDNRYRYPHIPHPFPLLPESMVPTSTGGRDSKMRNGKPKGAEDRILDRRMQLSYTEATNIYILGSEFTPTDFIDNFIKFEKSDQIGIIDPAVARRGRWVLIYSVLQTLANTTVDSPEVRYSDDVPYHLSPRLKGTKVPPWKGVTSHLTEAAHELSFCWTTPEGWNNKNEGGDSDGSAGDDPILRMMRSQASAFPRGSRSVTSRSNKTGPSGWGASSSAMSTFSDDAASSVGRAPSVSSSTHYAYSSRSKPSRIRVGNDLPTGSSCLSRVISAQGPKPANDDNDESSTLNDASPLSDWLKPPAKSKRRTSINKPPPLPLITPISGGSEGGLLGLDGNSPRDFGSRSLLSPSGLDALRLTSEDFDSDPHSSRI